MADSSRKFGALSRLLHSAVVPQARRPVDGARSIMVWYLQSCGSIGRGMAGLLALALTPCLLRAETITIVNNSRVDMVVQCAVVVGRQVKRDKPQIVKPGASAAILAPAGEKLITVYDGRTNRVLIQTTIAGAKDDQAFAIEPNLTGTRVTLEAVKPIVVAPAGDGKKDPDPPPKGGGLPPK